MHRLLVGLRIVVLALVLAVVAIWSWQGRDSSDPPPRVVPTSADPAGQEGARQEAAGQERAGQEAAGQEAVGQEAVGQEWDVVSVIDGDTLIARRAGVEETVRLLVIDAPERGQCGYDDARDTLASLVDGRTVVLVPGSVDDRDQFGRLLRYVEVSVDGEMVDAGRRLLELGLAAAIYDSRIGFPRHDREDEYIAADDAAPDACPDMRVH